MSATAIDPLEARYRARSLWLDGVPGPLLPRPSLVGDLDVDVAIVGAGYTGLWTAYYLLLHDPSLRVAILEREIAGFGASGRNGGWVSGGIAGDAAVYARRHGDDAVARAERASNEAVAEIGRVVVEESIECGYVPGGSIWVATSEAQRERLLGLVERKRQAGSTDDDLRLLTVAELEERVHIPHAVAGSYTPHCARIDPARLARGLAEAVERRGGVIYERTAVEEIQPGVVRCEAGTVRAATIVRATEAFTIEFAGEKRRYLPLYSLMIATEPLPSEVWDEIGWAGGETIGDVRHLFFYAQRTTDDRIAIGGRGAPYRLGDPIREEYERRPEVRSRLENAIRVSFPAAAGARITHHWGGALGVPRDWSCAIHHDRATGLAWAGGYSGHGVAATNVSGRTLADLILERDSDLVTLPWVGHTSRRWEPEPLRFVASRAIVAVMGSADHAEEHLPRTARRMRLVEPFIAGH